MFSNSIDITSNSVHCEWQFALLISLYSSHTMVYALVSSLYRCSGGHNMFKSWAVKRINSDLEVTRLIKNDNLRYSE